MSDKNKAIIEAARDRMKEAVDADRENRERGFDDIEKLVGRQWPDEIRKERDAENKPCLTLNRLPQFVRQVTGDIRQTNPAINVSASDDEATEEIAEIYEGIIRSIEQQSDASAIYEGAAESAAACSIGWFRVRNDWRDKKSFDQEITVTPIRNPFSVYCDPAAEHPTRKDSDYLFITEAMELERFKKAYPNASTVSLENDQNVAGDENWADGTKVIIAEYYWKETKPRKLHMLVDGSTIYEDEAKVEIPEDQIQRTRTVDDEKIMWAKISHDEVLEGPTEVPCSYIPVIAVTGEEWMVGEDRYRSSVIRFAKDGQQLYNYFRSSQAELVTLQPKAPFIGTLKQFQGLEQYWQNANVKNYSYLPYNVDEKAPGAPQRQQPPVSSQGLMEQALQAADDMKATTGIYDAALGNQSNETSGVAIRQRQMESDVSTSVYTDNMAKAIAHCGRILISMIPRVYDTKRLLRTIGKDGGEEFVTVNDLELVGGEASPVNPLSMGTYDLRVTVGPNYATRRQETAEGMIEFMRTVPHSAQVIGDLVAKAMDWPDADVIADRLKSLLPPNLAENESPEAQAAMAQQMEAQQQQQAMAQAMQATEIEKAQAETIEAKADAEKASIEVEKERLELLMQSGAMNDAIASIVQQQVAATLAGMSGTPTQ